MENFRSKSTIEGRMQRENNYYGERQAPQPTGMYDLRSYSTSSSYYHPSSYHVAQQQPPPQPQPQPQMGKEVMKMKKMKSCMGPSFRSLSLNDPELQRKKRVAGYKVYSVEGKMKGSLRRSFKWIKNTCIHMVHGF